jgi:hypothetical protein
MHPVKLFVHLFTANSFFGIVCMHSVVWSHPDPVAHCEGRNGVLREQGNIIMISFFPLPKKSHRISTIQNNCSHPYAWFNDWSMQASYTGRYEKSWRAWVVKLRPVVKSSLFQV